MRKKLLLITLLTASTILVAGNYSRSNNIVTDHDTGLQWQDQPYTAAEKKAYNSTAAGDQTGKAQKWKNAAAVCRNLNLGGSGWRLPTIKELDTLVDTKYRNPATDPIFQNSIGLGHWSGTTYPENTNQAYGIGFLTGGWHHCNKDGRIKFIRCVRKSGETTPPPTNPTPTPPPPSGTNNPPKADAGPDKTVQVNNPVTIDGSGSTDSDGAIVSYRWTRNGSFYTNKETFDFTPSGTKTKTFELTVTDDEGAKNTDKMVLTVTNDSVPPPPTGNAPLTADAGPDKTVQVNHPVTISGSTSGGAIVSYQWKKKSTNQILSKNETFDFTPTGTKTKTLVFTIVDDEGTKASDEMVLTVTK